MREVRGDLGSALAVMHGLDSSLARAMQATRRRREGPTPIELTTSYRLNSVMSGLSLSNKERG